MATVKNAQGVLVDSVTGLPVVSAGGTGDYGTYKVPGTTETIGVDKAAFDQMSSVGTEGLAANQGWTDTVANWFRPEGDKGTSVGGNVMGAIGTGVNAATGLAGLFYTGKNYELAKEAADLEKKQAKQLMARQAKVDAAGEQIGRNAGNGASYNYMNTVR